MVGRPDYELRQALRRDRLEKRAERLQREAKGRFARADLIAKRFEGGQPILVGHHSEKGARRDQERIHQNMRKGIDAQQKARATAARADSVGSGGISSDDPTALEQITARIAELEKSQDMMRAANKLLRKKDANAGDEGLRALGINDRVIATMRKGDCMGTVGFASFELSNNSANIRRLKARLATLKRVDDVADSEERFGDVAVEIVPSDNRVRVRFPGKPARDVIKRARGYGFRWAPSEGAWQRHYSNSAVYWARELAKLATTTEGKDAQ